MRRALIQAGVKPAGMTPDEITAAYNQLDIIEVEDIPVTPAISSSKPKIDDLPLPDAVTPSVNKVPANSLTDALNDAIQIAIGSTPTSIDEQQVIKLIHDHAPRPDDNLVSHEVTVISPTQTTTTTGAHHALADTLDVITMQENAYLVGSAGTGKTTLAMQAAKALSVDFHMTGAVLDKFELLGFVDAGGVYHRTPFREAIEHGGVFLWDEVDSSLPAPLNFFNGVLENGVITFPDGETFTVDREKTYFIAAANTVGTGATRAYVGRYELDRAFLDRFVQVDVNYQKDIELSMAITAWIQNGGDKAQTEHAITWANIVMEFRQLLDDRNILALCTPRATRHGAALLAKGWDADKVKHTCLHKHLSHDQKLQLGINA